MWPGWGVSWGDWTVSAVAGQPSAAGELISAETPTSGETNKQTKIAGASMLLE